MSTSPPKSILIADDNRLILQALRLLFESHGYSVVTANDGNDAIQKFDGECSPDCVILDYNMPNLSGADVAEHIKKTAPTTPVILTSANAASLRHQAKVRALFDAVFDKPIMIKDLFSCIEKLQLASHSHDRQVA